MLELQNVCKSYGNQMILKNVSFKLEPSEKLSIIGPSGAGKTTILRVINDLAFIDSGDIIVNGEYLLKNGETQNITDYSKKLGMVFQNYNLFPHMTALENIMSPLINVYNINKKQAEKQALEVLEKVNLLEKRDKYPYELSGGEKQRVAISRAYVLKPEIICLDEPTSALDPESIIYIENLINTLSQEGIGILIISHDMNFAKRVSDRVIFLEDGEIKEILDLKDGQDIENKRVKGFMGFE